MLEKFIQRRGNHILVNKHVLECTIFSEHWMSCFFNTKAETPNITVHVDYKLLQADLENKTLTIDDRVAGRHVVQIDFNCDGAHVTICRQMMGWGRLNYQQQHIEHGYTGRGICDGAKLSSGHTMSSWWLLSQTLTSPSLLLYIHAIRSLWVDEN